MKPSAPRATRPFGTLQVALGLALVLVLTAGFGKPGCGSEPVAVIAEVDDPCHSAQVECAAGLACVSHYDGGQMLCKAPCASDVDCPSGEVCDLAPQISEAALGGAPLVCQAACTSLAGSGCGGAPGQPEAIVKWEVRELGDHYNLRGINADGDAYLDAMILWYGDESFTVAFYSPAACEFTMSIAEAMVYDNTCDAEAAEAISDAGFDLFTDIGEKLEAAKDEANPSWISKGCGFIVGGLGTVAAGFFGVGLGTGVMIALMYPAMGGAGITGVAGLALATGLEFAWPAIAAFGVAAGGCWLYGRMQEPPLSACITECSFGDGLCFDTCIDAELEVGDLAPEVLLPQCVLACEQDDDNCLEACSYLLL